MVARTLVKRRSASVVLLVQSLLAQVCAEIAAAIEGVSRRRGYSLYVVTTMNDAKLERNEIESSLARGVDGIVTAATLATSHRLIELAQGGFPVVFVLRRPFGSSDLDYVVVNDVKGGYLAAEHLIRLGHRRIGLIRGPANTSTGIERFEGAMRAFGDYGVPALDDLMNAGDYFAASGYQAASRMLHLPKGRRPTALFAFNDDMAIGAMECALQQGMRVPEDLAIVGFDNSETTRLRPIQITTISQEAYEMGQMGIRRLLQKIEKKRGCGRPYQKVLDPTLIIRKSCGFHHKERYELRMAAKRSMEG
jgi:LacI family transcriptional regulator